MAWCGFDESMRLGVVEYARGVSRAIQKKAAKKGIFFEDQEEQERRELQTLEELIEEQIDGEGDKFQLMELKAFLGLVSVARLLIETRSNTFSEELQNVYVQYAYVLGTLIERFDAHYEALPAELGHPVNAATALKLIFPDSEKKKSQIMEPRVIAICISPVAKGAMQQVEEVEAIAGAGLKGDRYCTAEGSFSKGKKGKRQVTLINGAFFKGSGFEYIDTRRNIVTIGVELMDLIGKEFQIGDARMRGLRYCDPCTRPDKLTRKTGFKEKFHDRGGLVAEILQGGMIRVGDPVIPPPKDYKD